MWNLINIIKENILSTWNRHEQEDIHRELMFLLKHDKSLTEAQFKALWEILFYGGQGALYDIKYKRTHVKQINMYLETIRGNKSFWNDIPSLYNKFKEEYKVK